MENKSTIIEFEGGKYNFVDGVKKSSSKSKCTKCYFVGMSDCPGDKCIAEDRKTVIYSQVLKKVKTNKLREVWKNFVTSISVTDIPISNDPDEDQGRNGKRMRGVTTCEVDKYLLRND